MSTQPKRALIFAGGGVKVAFQAGVLQVWLDEAGIKFDLADGCSGGCFNLAMYCQGKSGTEIADTWRRHRPLDSLDVNWSAMSRLMFAESIFELGRMRSVVFPKWGLDWDKIRASKVEATFNAYNFSKHHLSTWLPAQMDEDKLIACVSLPMWFPPVKIGGETHIDAVFITDANLEEAIARGADELWVIWTMSQLDEWNDGFIAQYFQIIETSANGHLRRVLHRIAVSNDAVAKGKSSEFGRHIEVKMLESEVSLHYLINLSGDRFTEAVNAGVVAARKWCKDEGIKLTVKNEEAATDVHTVETRLSFTEEMKGFVTFGEPDPQRGYDQGSTARNDLMVHLTIDVNGVNKFVTWPDHAARASGWAQGAAINGRRPVVDGVFNLFIDKGDPRLKLMRYRLHIGGDERLTILGQKFVHDDPGFDSWTDLTTLFTRVVRGHVEFDDDGDVVASGILRIHMRDFLKQLTTFRTDGPTAADRSAALGRFGAFFMGDLWEVYAREILA